MKIEIVIDASSSDYSILIAVIYFESNQRLAGY